MLKTAQAFFLIVLLGMTTFAQAVEYRFNSEELQSFSELYDDPVGSASLVWSINESGYFAVGFQETPAAIGLGVVGSGSFSGYDSIMMDIYNSSGSFGAGIPIYASLFVQNSGGYTYGDVLDLNDNEQGTLMLDLAGVDTSAIISYGFEVGTNVNGNRTLIHAAAVPEPTTLLLLGGGLIGLAGLRKRRS